MKVLSMEEVTKYTGALPTKDVVNTAAMSGGGLQR